MWVGVARPGRDGEETGVGAADEAEAEDGVVGDALAGAAGDGAEMEEGLEERGGMDGLAQKTISFFEPYIVGFLYCRLLLIDHSEGCGFDFQKLRHCARR